MVSAAKRAKLRKIRYLRKFRLAHMYFTTIEPKSPIVACAPRSFIQSMYTLSPDYPYVFKFDSWKRTILSQQVRPHRILIIEPKDPNASYYDVHPPPDSRIPALGRTHRCRETECGQVMCAMCPNTSSWPSLPILTIESAYSNQRYVGAGLSKLTYVAYDNLSRFYAVE